MRGTVAEGESLAVIVFLSGASQIKRKKKGCVWTWVSIKIEL